MASYLPNATDIFPDPVLFTPDFKFLDNALQRKQLQYERGFAQVSQRYNTLNSQLLHPEHVKQRDEYMRQALNNLKDLSSMDLSLPQNVQSAVNAFSPIYQNKNLIADFQLAKFYQQQAQLSEADRSKDGGKNYNASSVAQINRMIEAYQNDKPENVGTYLQSKVYYTPFVDYTKKMMDIFDKYKPKTVIRDVPLGNGRTRKTVVTDYDLGALRAAIDLSLNPQEKNQIRLDGMAQKGNLYSDPVRSESIVKEYAENGQRLVAGYDAKIKELTLQKQNAPTKEKKAQIDQMIENLNSSKRSIAGNIQSLQNADYFSRRTMLENMAGEIYLTNLIDDFAVAKSKSDTKDEISYGTDTAFFELYKIAKDEQDRREKKEKEQKSILIDGPFLVPTDIDPEKAKTEPNAFMVQQSAVKQAMSDASNSILDHLKTRNKNATSENVEQWVRDMEQTSKTIARDKKQILINTQTGKPLTQSEINDYNEWKTYKTKMSSLNLQLEAIKSEMNQSEEGIARANPEAYKRLSSEISRLNGGQNISIRTTDGKVYNLTPQQFFNKVSNNEMYRERIDGKQIDPSSAELVNQNINALVKLLASPDGRIIRDARAKQATVDASTLKVRAIDFTTARGKQVKDYLEQRMGGKFNYTVKGATTGTNSDLVIEIGAPGKGQLDPTTSSDAEKMLMQNFGRDLEVVNKAAGVYKIRGLDVMGLLDKYTPNQAALYKILESPNYKGTQEGKNSYRYTINNVPLDNTDAMLRIEKVTKEVPNEDGTVSPEFTYYVFDSEVKDTYLLKFNSAAELTEMLRVLSMNPEEAAQLLGRLRAENQ